MAQMKATNEEKDRIIATSVFGASLGRMYSTGAAAFTGTDTSKDGVIDAAELATAAGQFQYKGEPADLYQDLDTSKDGKITLSELTQFARAYMPAVAGAGGSVQKVHWSPGYDGEFRDQRKMPITSAHRRRTLAGLSATGGGVGIGPASQVLWMRLGRTTSLVPVAWVGEYDQLGDGQCQSMEAHTPVSADVLNLPQGVCQGKCDLEASCYGFSWSRQDNTCRLWKESGLRGGGPKWNGCDCKVKVFDIVRDAVVADGSYENMGAGKCLSGAGRDYPESVFHQNVDENFCKTRCTMTSECFGYTWNAQLRQCYHWKLTDLRAPPDGTVGTAGESCMVKICKISQRTGAETAAPPNAAPLLGPYDLASPNVNALKISLGRTISSIPVTWNGQWKVQEPAASRCMTSSAQEPQHRILRNVDAARCEATCGGDPSCFGYSWSKAGMCLVWMQPDLWGGGPKIGGFSCIIKQFAVITAPVVSSNKFIMAGPGMCKTGWDTNPASSYLGKVPRERCRISCQNDDTCTGFSWQPSGECAAHYEAGLRSSRSTFGGNIACYVKDYQQQRGTSSGGTFANDGQATVQGAPSFRGAAPQQQGYSQGAAPQQPVYNGGGGNGGGWLGQSNGGATAPQQQPAISARKGGENANNANSDNNNNGNGDMAKQAGNWLGNQAGQEGLAAVGHSTGALMAGMAGTAAAVHVGHRMSGSNNNNNKVESGPSARAFADAGDGSSSARGRQPVFRFWTPNNTGSATCKTDLPKRGFPAVTDLQSNAAWQSGHQPRNDECWKKESLGNFEACWYTKVLFSTDRGWPGKCQGLMSVDTKGLSCKESCIRNPSCPVWQTFWRKGKTNEVCMQGRGRDCPGMRGGRNQLTINAAERIQHGTIRVLMELKGMEIRNLRQDFDAEYYTRRQDATFACKAMCYSDIKCQYWLYSTTDGCFLEDPPMHSVQYPLTKKDVNHNSAFAKSVIVGEYILHRCPENDGSFTSENEKTPFTLLPWKWNWFAVHAPWDEGGWPWWGWVLFVLVTICVCCCCLCICAVAGGITMLRGKPRTAVSDSDKDSLSDSSSDSESDTKRGRGNKSQKEALLQGLSHGHGHQTMQVSTGHPVPSNANLH